MSKTARAMIRELEKVAFLADLTYITSRVKNFLLVF